MVKCSWGGTPMTSEGTLPTNTTLLGGRMTIWNPCLMLMFPFLANELHGHVTVHSTKCQQQSFPPVWCLPEHEEKKRQHNLTILHLPTRWSGALGSALHVDHTSFAILFQRITRFRL
mmetsp:Transcript_10795/g.25028  ORF Transcript_10795/g.25028 Transcript_10795/m.25028 type:complete len:117 (+) Transcript_10795:988-1338(+)